MGTHHQIEGSAVRPALEESVHQERDWDLGVSCQVPASRLLQLDIQQPIPLRPRCYSATLAGASSTSNLGRASYQRSSLSFTPVLAPDPEPGSPSRANFQGFVLLNDRARDRAELLERVTALSEKVLEEVDGPFSPAALREIELQLIRERLEDVPEEERATYTRLIGRAFPDLTEAEILEAIE